MNHYPHYYLVPLGQPHTYYARAPGKVAKAGTPTALLLIQSTHIAENYILSPHMLEEQPKPR